MRIMAIFALLLLGFSTSSSAGSRYLTPKAAPGVIVFVHGVFGDSTSTWTNSSTNTYWPGLVSKDQIFKDFAVYVYNYPSPKLGTTYSINELAENMRLTLQSDEVFAHQSIIILSHSMGGLITRSLLLKYRELAPKIRSLHFFATPTTGSEAAQIGRILSSNPQLGQMIRMDSATYLADLQRDWLAANFPFPSYCAYELRPTFGLKIVEQQSATNLCNRRLDPIDSNHIDIVKPSGVSDTPYLAFRSAFMETQAVTKPQGLTADQKEVAVNLGVNFATLAFTRLAGARTEDLDARISGQLAQLDLPANLPPAEAKLGEIRLFQEQIRGHLKRKDQSLYPWYRYGFLYYGTVPILEMIKQAIASNDMNTFHNLKKQATTERPTYLELENSLGFPSALKSRSQSIQDRLMSITEHDSTDTLLTVQQDIVSYIAEVANWAGTK